MPSCRNTSSFARVDSSRALSFAIVRPALEKTRSDGADVAGMARYFMARLAKYGKSSLWTLYQSKGLENSPLWGSLNFAPFAALYNSISF